MTALVTAGDTAKGRAASAAEGGARVVKVGERENKQAARKRCLFVFPHVRRDRCVPAVPYFSGGALAGGFRHLVACSYA